MGGHNEHVHRRVEGRQIVTSLRDLAAILDTVDARQREGVDGVGLLRFEEADDKEPRRWY